MKRRPFRIGQRLSGSYPNKPQTSQILRERVRPSRRFTEATEEGDPTSAKQAQLEPGGSVVFAVVRFMPPLLRANSRKAICCGAAKRANEAAGAGYFR